MFYNAIKRSLHKNTSIQKAFIISLASFFILLWLGATIGRSHTYYLANKSENILKEALAADSKRIFEQSVRIAEGELLRNLISSGDSYEILEVLNHEKEKLNSLIDIIGVTDKDGFVISRSQISKGIGDNIFISSAIGRLAAMNIATSSIEVRGIDPTQLLAVAGIPMLDGDSRTGVLLAARILGDEYSAELKSKLPKGAEIVFYTKENGICGMSFKDQLERKKIQAYINSDSDFVKHGKTEDVINMRYGKAYFVKNLEFPGLESSPGGAILFIPNHSSAIEGHLAASFLTFIIFVLLAFFVHRNKPREDKGKTYWNMVLLALILLCVIIFITSTAYFVDYVRSKKEPFVLYNSTLRLIPDSATFNSETESNVSIVVDTGEESVNAFDVEINFDPDMIRVDDISIENSICSELIEKNVDNNAGKIRMACIVVSPGYVGRGGNLANIIFRVQKHGQFGLIFDGDTKVLANDGLGTSVLRTALSGSYHGEVRSAELGEGGVRDLSLTSPDIYSPTHPNSERWYRAKEVKFRWSNPEQRMFAYSFNQLPDDIPSLSSTTTSYEFFETIRESGIYYFHLSGVDSGNIGPAGHYKAMIDLDGPRNVTIKSSATEVEVGDIVRFIFNATSSNSELQRTFYLNMGGGSELFYPVSRETYAPILDPLGAGVQKITIRVFDMAGNYVDQAVEIKVNGSPIRNLINRFFNSF